MIALTQNMVMAVACPNEVLLRKGFVATSMYVVLRGKLEVLLQGGRLLSVYTTGACFGEQSLLTGAASENFVVAVSYCVLYTLHIDDFNKCARSPPDCACACNHLR